MAITVRNFFENDDVEVTTRMHNFMVAEWKRDLSVDPGSAASAWFSAQMNVRRRQLAIDLAQGPATVQAGAMQWMAGQVNMSTGVRGAGDLLGKAFRGAASGESAIKPEYTGNGLVVLEPTYKYILLEDVSQWGGGIVLEDGIFLACSASLQQKTIRRTNVSSAVAGGEGIFNLGLTGQGVVALESPVPREELVEIILQNDEVKIDGPYAIAWSPTLQFTVERSSKSLIGSAASGEGLVNVYRGTGRLLMAPTR